jgi:hypothetical protein
VLPIAIDGDIRAHLAAFPPGVAPVGMAAGLFHPVTGYSFPDAVRLALHIAALPDLGGAAIDRAARAIAVSTWESAVSTGFSTRCCSALPIRTNAAASFSTSTGWMPALSGASMLAIARYWTRCGS